MTSPRSQLCELCTKEPATHRISYFRDDPPAIHACVTCASNSSHALGPNVAAVEVLRRDGTYMPSKLSPGGYRAVHASLAGAAPIAELEIARILALGNVEIISSSAASILIRDVSDHRGGKSITNDAARVVEAFAPVLRGRKLYYLDTAGDCDELVVSDDGRFLCFAPGPDRAMHASKSAELDACTPADHAGGES